jgi:hypothetical protein
MATTTIPGFSVGIAADIADFLRGLGRVENETKKVARAVEQQGALMAKGFGAATAATNQLRTAVVGLAAGLGVERLASFTAAAFKTAGDLGELAQQAGVTARQLQVLQFAGVSAGLAQEGIGRSLAQLGKRLGEAALGTGALKDVLKQYSISIKDAEGHTRTSYDVLGDLAEAVQNAGSQTEQLRIVQAALGRGGAEWIPILSQGREGLEAFATTAERAGLILGPAFIKKADDAVDHVAMLQFADPVLARQIKTAKDQDEALRLVADAIQRTDSASTAAAISVAAFGGAGEELAAVFRSGREGIDSYRAEAERLGIVLSDDLVKAAQERRNTATIVQRAQANAR